MKALETLRSGSVLATRIIGVDDERSVVLVASIEGRPRIEGRPEDESIGTARYDVDPASGLAAVSLAVSEAWQGRGVGTVLFRQLWQIGQARGVAGFMADVPIGNSRMLALFTNSGLRLESVLQHGLYCMRMSFPGQQQVG